MEANIVNRIRLDNDLELLICDECKKLVGDRWLVKIATVMDIPTDSIGEEPRDAQDILGKSVRFESRRERNFISADEKEAVFQSLCDFFLDTSLSYLSHPDFARKYVMKKYREAVQKICITAERKGAETRKDNF